MIAIVYASLLIFAVAAPAITSLGWLALGCLALPILAYFVYAEWELCMPTGFAPTPTSP